MSELIRAAADDAQLEIQHKRLLAQVQQLYQLTGQQGACQPTAQLAALKSCMEMVGVTSLMLMIPCIPFIHHLMCAAVNTLV